MIKLKTEIIYELRWKDAYYKTKTRKMEFDNFEEAKNFKDNIFPKGHIYKISRVVREELVG